MKIVKDVLSLKFRTTARDGVLLHGEGQQGDYISLELRRARLQLSLNLGSLVSNLRGFKDHRGSPQTACHILRKSQGLYCLTLSTKT